MNMDPERFDSLLNDVGNAIPEITCESDINIGSKEKVAGLLEQAREARELSCCGCRKPANFIGRAPGLWQLTYRRGKFAADCLKAGQSSFAGISTVNYSF
jgi:hypothetical protein